MTESPGHRRWPEYRIRQKHVVECVQVEVGGQIVAESDNVVELDEENHPARFYFPRSDVRMDWLVPSQTTTQCPFKGSASYFDLKVSNKCLKDVAWTYEDPYDEHRLLKDRIAFASDQYPEIRFQMKHSRSEQEAYSSG